MCDVQFAALVVEFLHATQSRRVQLGAYHVQRHAHIFMKLVFDVFINYASVPRVIKFYPSLYEINH